MAGFMYETKGLIRGGPNHLIGDNRDIHRPHRWHIVMISGLNIGTNEDIKLFAKKLKLPELSFEEESVAGIATDYKVAAKAKFSDVTVDFYDVDGLYAKFEELRKKIWTPENGIAPAVNYKADSIFILESPTKPWTRFTLKNSYIKNISHSELNYEENGFKSLSLSIGYDWFETAEIPNPLALLNTVRGSITPFINI